MIIYRVRAAAWRQPVCRLHVYVHFHVLPVVHVGMEAAAVHDGLGQGQSVQQDVHVVRVGGGAHLFGDVVGVIPLAAVRQDGVYHQLVFVLSAAAASPGAFAEGEEAARDGGRAAVHRHLEGQDAGLSGGWCAHAGQGATRHTREGAAQAADVFQVRGVAYLHAVVAGGLFEAEGEDGRPAGREGEAVGGVTVRPSTPEPVRGE